MADETQRVIAPWAEAMSLPQAPATFAREVLVRENCPRARKRVKYWLPVQKAVADAMIRELEPGQAIEIFFLVNEFVAAGKR